ncbi:hypothetical protein D3C80_471600 [compost metagenome]
MRNSLLRFHQTAGNGLAHTVVRNDFVCAFFKELEDGIIRLRLWSRCCCLRCSRSSFCATRLDRRFNVTLNDAAIWASAFYSRNINASVLCDAAGKRRCKNAFTLVLSAFTCSRSSRWGFSLYRSRSCRRCRFLFGLFLRRICLWCRSGIATFRCFRNILAVFGENCDQRVNLDAFSSGRNHQLGNNAFVDSFDFHRRLIGFNLGNHIAGRNLVAFFNQPLGKIAFFHGWRKRWHGDLNRHVQYLLRRCRSRLSPLLPLLQQLAEPTFQDLPHMASVRPCQRSSGSARRGNRTPAA